MALVLGLELVLLSDDMNIELFGHTHTPTHPPVVGLASAYAENNPIPTVKYGVGYLLWGYFASTCPRALVKVNGIMNL